MQKEIVDIDVEKSSQISIVAKKTIPQRWLQNVIMEPKEYKAIGQAIWCHNINTLQGSCFIISSLVSPYFLIRLIETESESLD